MDLALVRKRLGITQTQMAEKLDVDQGTISNWERGEYLPSVTRLPKVAEAYGVTVDELLSGSSGSVGKDGDTG